MDINMKVVQNKGKSEVILRRSASDIDEDYLEHRLKKQSNFSFHKNLDFLQKHNKLFSKPIYNSGDADTYFRNILRNYDQSDLFKDFNWGRRNFPKTTQSFESLRERSRSKKFSSLIEVKTKKTKSASKLPSGKELKSAKVKKLKKQPKPPSEEPEVEEFYSPGSRTVIDSVGSSFTLLEKDDFPLQEKDEYPLQEKDEYPLQEKVNYISQEKDDLQDNIETEVIEVDNSTAVAKMAEEGADLPDVTDDEEEMSDVEQMIADTEEEMDKMDEENKEIMDQVEGAEMAKADTKAMEGSTFKFDPAIDAAILKELEDAEKQAKEIACIILEIKNRINELLQKEKMTEVEAKELEEKNNELKAQMILFEEETKRIQCLIEQSNLFENMIMPKPPRQVKHAEDMLPKVIVCGMTENDMPKILVCDEKVKRSRCSQRPNPCMAPQMAKKLSDSYTMQQKLASENAGLEGMRYQLQSDLLNKEQTVDQLQKTLSNLQAEMRMICKENASLNERMQQYRQSGANQSSPCGTCGTGSPLGQPQINQYAAPPSGQWGQPPANQWGQPPCMPPQTNQWGQGQPQMPQNMGGNSGCGTPSSAKSKKRCCGQSKPCPVQLENKLNAYNITTLQLEQQITDIENEVTNMQNEVMEVQKAREHLDRHRQMLCCPPPPCGGPCPPPPCGMPCPPPPCGMPCPLPPCGMPCPPPPCGMPCPPPPCGGL